MFISAQTENMSECERTQKKCLLLRTRDCCCFVFLMTFQNLKQIVEAVTVNSVRDKTCLSLILLRSLHRKHTPALSRWLSLHEEDFLWPSNGLKDTHT